MVITKYIHNFFSNRKENSFKEKYENVGVVETEINGSKILVFPKTTIGKQILVNGKFEEQDTAFISSIIKDDWNIIDVGCNIGYYTILFSKLASSGHVWAVDPIPYHIHVTGVSCHLNSIRNISLINKAISFENTTTSFSICEDGAFSSLKENKRSAQAQKIDVETVTLDSLLDLKEIDYIHFMKVDVEGAEELVVRGARESLKSQRIGIIMIEVCPSNLQNFDTNQAIIDKLFKDCGYEGFILEHGKLVKFNADAPIKSINVFYFNANEKASCLKNFS